MRCPVEVLLRDDGTVYDTAQFSECAVAQQPSRVDGHWNLGIGDPLLSDKGLTVWGMGYENLFVSVHARPIELAEDRREKDARKWACRHFRILVERYDKSQYAKNAEKHLASLGCAAGTKKGAGGE